MYLLTVLSILFLLKFNFRCGFWQLTQQKSDVLFKMSPKFQLSIILRVIYVILSMQKKQDGNRKFFLFESQHMSPRMSQLMNQLIIQLMNQLMSQPMIQLMNQRMSQLMNQRLSQLMSQHMVTSLTLLPQTFFLSGNIKTFQNICCFMRAYSGTNCGDKSNASANRWSWTNSYTNRCYLWIYVWANLWANLWTNLWTNL